MTRTGSSFEASARRDRDAAEDHTAHQATSTAPKPHFWRHFAEMVIAMFVGMAVLGVPARAILDSLGYTVDEAVARFPEIVCLVMTFNMAFGMVAWMRYRRHSWRASLEMTLAMYVAAGVALAMLWLHIITEEPLLGLMHILMLPAMLFLMLFRRDEYAYAHH